MVNAAHAVSNSMNELLFNWLLISDPEPTVTSQLMTRAARVKHAKFVLVRETREVELWRGDEGEECDEEAKRQQEEVQEWQREIDRLENRLATARQELDEMIMRRRRRQREL